jgi:hypothetical protein
MSDSKYPADLPLSQKLALDAQERIAIALERIATATETLALPIAEFGTARETR